MKLKFLLVLMALTFIGCDDMNKPSADSITAEKTERAMGEANRQVGMPAIVNFSEKKLAKMIYELRDQESLLTYTYYISMDGTKHFLGKSIGYGLPYSTQFSNPMRNLEDGGYNGQSNTVIPQAEPNGLFMPDGLSATWILLINPETNQPHPIYVESEIMVSPFKLH